MSVNKSLNIFSVQKPCYMKTDKKEKNSILKITNTQKIPPQKSAKYIFFILLGSCGIFINFNK